MLARITAIGAILVIALMNPSLIQIQPYGRFQTSPGSAVRSLALDHSGSLLAAGEYGGIVRLFSRDGSLLWKYPIGGFGAVVALSADGRFLAVGDGDKYLFFFSTNGTLLWKKAYGAIDSVAIAGDGGRIAFVTNYYALFVLDRGGNEVWRAKGGPVMQGASMTHNGSYIAVLGEDKIYPIDKGGRLLLYNASGKMIWSRRLDDFIDPLGGARLSAPAIAEDGTIAVAGDHGPLRLFDLNGNLIWERRIGGAGPEPAMGSFGDRVVVMPADGRYVAVGTGLNASPLPPEGGHAMVRVFSREDQVELARLEAPELYSSYRVLALGVSGDGNWVAASPNLQVAPFFFLFKMLSATTQMNTSQPLVTVTLTSNSAISASSSTTVPFGQTPESTSGGWNAYFVAAALVTILVAGTATIAYQKRHKELS